MPRSKNFVWVAILACLIASSSGIDAPTGSYEVDLIFPRVGTPASAAAPVPLVFAVQNYAVAVASGLCILWKVYGFEDGSTPTAQGSLCADDGPEWRNWPNTVPYFIIAPIQNLTTSEDITSWQLTWDLLPNFCVRYGSEIDNSFPFNTTNSAPPVDLVAATAANTCNSTMNVVFAVASYGQTEDNNSPATCANEASGAQIQSNPCAVAVNATVASQILQSVSYDVCTEGANPGQCVDPSATNATASGSISSSYSNIATSPPSSSATSPTSSSASSPTSSVAQATPSRSASRSENSITTRVSSTLLAALVVLAVM